MLNVHLSTIYREIKRNQTTLRNTYYEYYTTYLSSAAHTCYLEGRKNNSNSSKFTKDIKFIIEQGLKSDLSLSTICGLRHKPDKSFPSSRTLYNYFKRSWISNPKNYRLKLKKERLPLDLNLNLKMLILNTSPSALPI